METALSIKGLRVSYGAIEAVKGIDIEVTEGSVVALLGANGAGKTSTLRTISGLVPAAAGTISFYGQDITNMDAEKIAALGIAQSPEGRQIFGDLTVEENLKAGAFTVRDRKIIEKAKWLLVEKMNMTEPQAHRYIQKRAMDSRTSQIKVAEEIILSY
jgi:branched-chain amino acid transport system ATP-binding protein